MTPADSLRERDGRVSQPVMIGVLRRWLIQHNRIDKKHPNPRVTNAYWRRGAKVFTTAGLSKRFYYGTCPCRDGSPATSFPFYDGPVETGDDE